MEFEYGRIEQVAPGVRRVIANNPSAIFHGTGTYILGEGDAAVIDPGPLDTITLKRFSMASGEKVTHVPPHHMDHSPGYQLMKPMRCRPYSSPIIQAGWGKWRRPRYAVVPDERHPRHNCGVIGLGMRLSPAILRSILYQLKEGGGFSPVIM